MRRILALAAVLSAYAQGPARDGFLAAQQAIQKGDSEAALRHLASILCRQQDGAACAARISAMRGTAYLISGRYEQALAAFSEGLRLYSQLGDKAHVADLLNNLGTVHFYRGEYADAHGRYLAAQSELRGQEGASWFASAAHLTAANLATLYQRLGLYRRALDLYQSLGRLPSGLSTAERAQFLSNLAVLNRRLGDPWKARALLEQSLRLLEKEMLLDAWLGVVKNLGIVLALDFRDLSGAERRFRAAIREAERTGNVREASQARLYLAEVQFRSGDYQGAGRLWERTLEESRALKTSEDEWRSLFGIARVLRRTERWEDAAEKLSACMDAVEALRGGVGAATLKTEFLADKSEVYEEALELLSRQGDVAGAFLVMERARALLLREGLGAEHRIGTLAEFQQRLGSGEAALLYRAGKSQSCVLWATRERAGLRRVMLSETEALRLLEEFRADVDGAGQAKAALARSLLAEIPVLDQAGVRRLWIAPDGMFSLLPFEILPFGGGVLVERFETAYLPAAWFLRPRGEKRARRWPWQLQMVAYAEPDLRAAKLLPGDERWAPLPHSGLEVDTIARLLPGASETYRGSVLTPAQLLSRAAGAPILHLATHGAGDPESAGRNRLLIGTTYLFGAHLPAGRINGVELAVLSACETDTGPLSRGGEGVQSLARAFLLAGARATVASLWKVDDRATRLLMEEFYRQLADGAEIAAALREAKLRFLRSQGPLRAPRYWAAFVVQGAATKRLPDWVSWARIWTSAGLLALVAAVMSRYYMSGQ